MLTGFIGPVSVCIWPITAHSATSLVPTLSLFEVFKRRISLHHRIPMADSVMLATARRFNATLWTQDSDFARLENVKYFARG
jgi:predicted nucleic acid-binding protein